MVFRKWRGRGLLSVILAIAPLIGLSAATDSPEFKEVYDVVRANAAGLHEAELNRAAVEGLLAKLNTRAWLIDANAQGPDTNVAALASSAVLETAYPYLRVSQITAALPETFDTALDKILATNKIKGLVIDLRYADGKDYAAAVAVADRFVGSDEPLIDWGRGVKRSTEKTNTFRLPVAVLVNHFTAGAAEALAAILRQMDVALLIGTNTAGQASITKDFTLKSGQTLRVATSPIKLGNGDEVGSLKPDIQVEVSAEDEKAYFVDAYKILPKPGSELSATNLASLSVTNRNPRRRLNEAELVRMLREGEDPSAEDFRLPKTPDPAKPVITDPALARAIDLLKALSVVRHTRF
jgi:hypothetical protein